MFLHLLFLLVTSDSSNFDRFEERHYDNQNCDWFGDSAEIEINKTRYEAGTNSVILRGCQNIVNVKLTKDIVQIRNYMFYGSSIKKIDFEANSELTTIGKGAFAFCEQLTSITLPSEVETISEGAFFHSAITAPGFGSCNSLSSIGASAYEESSLQGTVDLKGKPASLSIGNRAFYGTGISTVTLPEIRSIGDYAFGHCTALATITSPLNVATIGDYAFENTIATGNLEIRSTSIGEHAFYKTGSGLRITGILQRLNGKDPMDITIEKYAFAEKTIACSLDYPKETTDAINEFAFYKCKFETTTSLNLNNVAIGQYAFANASFATRCLLTLDNSNVGKHAFEFTSLTGQASLELQTSFDNDRFTLSDYAFYHSSVSTTSNGPLYLKNAVPAKSFAHCLNLRGLLNISSLTNGQIGVYAFGNCTNLAGPLEIDGASIGAGAFEFTNLANGLILTANHREATANPELTIGYRAFYGSSLSKDLLIHSFVETIGEYAFARCKGLSNSKITIYAQDIDQYAFAECGTLNEPITIYSNNIYFHAFDKTTIATLTIDTKYDHDADHDATTYHVHNQAFYGITFTKQVIIKDHVVIDDFAFIYSTFGQLLLINADSIGQYAFSLCNTSTTVDCNVSICDSVVKAHAFEYFGNHTTRTLTLEFHSLLESKSANIIGESAFYSTGFSNPLVIPRYYTAIGNSAFANCRRITSASINFGPALTSTAQQPTNNIGSHSFYGSGLTQLSITSNGLPVGIGSYAFTGLPINHELIMPLYLSYVGTSSFENCTALRGVVFNHNTPGLNSIDSRAFCSCTSLGGEIYIPSTVSSIGRSAFENCTQISRLTLILDGSLTYIYSRAFLGCSNLEGCLDIPFGVIEIGEYAFYNCIKLGDHLSVKSNVQTPTQYQKCYIRQHAFDGCLALKTLDFAPYTDDIGSNNYYQKLHTIGPYAFYNSGISGRLYLPSSLEVIGNNAFEETAISGSLVIPASVRLLGNEVFLNCRNIEGLRFNTFEDPSDVVPLVIGDRAFYKTSLHGYIEFPNHVRLIGESAFEDLQGILTVSFKDDSNLRYRLRIDVNAFRNTGLTGTLTLPKRLASFSNDGIGAGNYSFANCVNIDEVIIQGGELDGFVFENDTSITRLVMTGGETGPFNFRGCGNNITISLHGYPIIGPKTFEDYQEGFLYLDVTGDIDEKYDDYGYLERAIYEERAFYNSFLTGSLYFANNAYSIEKEAFAQCKHLLGYLHLSVVQIHERAFADSVFDGYLIVDFGGFIDTVSYDALIPKTFGETVFKGATGFTDLDVAGATSKTSINDYAFAGMDFRNGILLINEDINKIGKYAFAGCGFHRVEIETTSFTVEEGAFYNCDLINTTVDMSSCTTLQSNVPVRLFAGCSRLPSLIFPEISVATPAARNYIVHREAFSGCSSLDIHPDFFLEVVRIERNAFSNCRSIEGNMYIEDTLNFIDEYAFSGCTGLSGRMTIHVSPSAHKYIGPSAFSGCKGFKNGKLYIFVDKNEEKDYQTNGYQNMEGGFRPYYKYNYFLTIGNEAFQDTKFKTVYYNGRFQPECDYDIGFSHTKGIHTSSNYVNRSFCGYPLHSNKLSGGAIAGITIAVIVVVAALVILLLFFLCKMKKNKDKSEDEVEMNADP